MKKELTESFIVDAIRTPLGRRNGTLRGTHPVDLLSEVLRSIVKRSAIDSGKIEDIIAGCVTQIGEQGANIARNASLSAGFPESVPGTTVDRQCGSSLQALQFAVQGVQAGFYDMLIAGGVESMSRETIGSNITAERNPITTSIEDRYHLNGDWFSQAYGAELIAKKYGFSREELDQFSFNSHKRASASAEHFRNEIVPVETSLEQDGELIEVILDRDEGVRPDVSMEKMARLPPAFKGLELITAANASQISDGASGVLVASDKGVEENNLKPVAKVLSFSVVGVDPVTMLTGPIPATRKALERAGLGPEHIDIFEVNEAFAPVPMAWMKEFKVDYGKLNPYGGAIAMGHPLGATGGRIVATLLNGLRSSGKRIGLIAVCEGGGMANAAVIERI